MHVTAVPTNGMCGTRGLAAALPPPRAPAEVHFGSWGATWPQHLPLRLYGAHPPSASLWPPKGARVSKTPGVMLAGCHRPSHPVALYHLLCMEILFHFPAAHGQQSSCATLSCVTTVQLPNQPRQKGKGGAENGAAALANILLSSGTEQTVAGYGANLLQERIFNIPPLQESLEAAREPQAERCEDNNSSPRSALLRSHATGQK